MTTSHKSRRRKGGQRGQRARQAATRPQEALATRSASRSSAATAVAARPPASTAGRAAPTTGLAAWFAQAPAWLDYVLPACLFVAALALFLPRLATPPQYIYDEVYHAYTAGQYVAGNADAYVWYTQAPRSGVAYEWTHPPLGKLLIAGGIAVFGDNSFGWRYASALFGAIGVVVVYWLGLRLTGKRPVALLGAAFLLVDGLYFVQSRTGMPDVMVLVFTAAALASCYGYLTAPPDRVRWPLLRTGALMGLAVATKWNGAYAAAFIGLVALWRGWRVWRESQGRRPRPEALAGVRQHLIWVPVGLVALPLAIYLASYGPFFLTGHSFGQFVELQRQMYYYHTHLKATHAYASQWWEWPLALRPVWYYTNRTGDTVANIYANGNPLLYWAFLPAVLWVSWRWWAKRRMALVVLWIGFFGQWLPWAVSPRLAFVYHFLPAVPFGCLAVAVALADLWERDARWRAVAAAYVAVVVAAFVFFFPIYAALPLTPERFDLRMWLSSWR